jgi:hypothetical protein
VRRLQAKETAFGRPSWLPAQLRRAVERLRRAHALCPHLVSFHGVVSLEEEQELRRAALPAHCLRCRRQVAALFMRLHVEDANVGRCVLADHLSPEERRH